MVMPPGSNGSLQMFHLIIVRDLTAADIVPDEGDLLPALLAAMAFGIAVVSLRTWQRETDPSPRRSWCGMSHRVRPSP